jgi:hypothetical protein
MLWCTLLRTCFGTHMYFFIILLFLVGWDLATTGLLYQPQMKDDGDCAAIGGKRVGRGNRSTRRKPAPVPLCPLQIPHNLTRTRTRGAAVGSQRLPPWVMARPYSYARYSNTLLHILWRSRNRSVNFIFQVTPWNGIKGCKVGRARWPRNRSISFNPMSG